MDAVRMEAFPFCILCGAQGEPLYQDLPDRLFGVPGLFQLKQCKKCRLVWLDPRPITEDLSICYKNYYTHSESPREEKEPPHRPLKSIRDVLRAAILCGYFGYRHLHDRHILCRLGPLMAKIPFLKYKAVYEDMRERFPHYNNKPDNLLIDIGCGRGDYLKSMKDLGWNVLGIEPDSTSAAFAEKRGIPVVNGMLAETRLPEGTADQITMHHVIEHLSDPGDAIHESFKLLKQGGRLVIYTPNIESLGSKAFKRSWLHLDPPRHLFVFSSRSMEALLEKSSFHEWSIHTVSVSAKKIYDNSLLISKYSQIDGYSPVLPQRGRTTFSTKEALLCHLGMPYGEEIEATAIRQ